MFEFVRKHNRLFQFILALVIVPSFVLVGVQGYSRFSDADSAPVAEVGGHKITQAEWDAAHRREVDRMRAESPQLDSAFFDLPMVKRQTLDKLVNDRLLRTAADKLHLMTPDARLQRLFQSDPELQFMRNADGSLNKDALVAQGMSAAQFEAQYRDSLTVRQVLGGIGASATAASAPTDAALDALLQQREVQVQRLATKDFAAKLNPTEAELNAYYEDPRHAASFEAPEQAKVEYLVLDAETVKKSLTVTPEELRKYFDENAARFALPEERRARHILLKVDPKASADDKQKVKAQAQALLDEVRKTPASFETLARKSSQDTGSAAQGGDLGFFQRGAMVKPFEDAVFALKPGEIAPDVVESDFGFHVIQLVELKGGGKPAFESVEAQVRSEVLDQLAKRKFGELAETFSNTVYEQSDSLQPAAEKLALSIQSADAVTREPAPGATGPLANAKLLTALFDSDNLAKKRNTEAVETGPQQLVAARVISHTPARKKPLAEVKDAVRTAVVEEQAASMARKAGEGQLANLRKDPKAFEGAVALGAATTVSRAQPGDLARPVIDAVLGADARQLPAWLGVDLGSQGYALVRINKVLPADAKTKQSLVRNLTLALGQAEELAYLGALRERYKVKITATEPATAKP